MAMFVKSALRLKNKNKMATDNRGIWSKSELRKRILKKETRSRISYDVQLTSKLRA